jgi:DNA polymerase V
MNNKLLTPLFLTTVKAGFPSPADDFLENSLDLNSYLIDHPASTFLVRASGNSMINAGIFSGDILVVDRSKPIFNGKIGIFVLNDGFTVKRYKKNLDGTIWLIPENSDHQPIQVQRDDKFEVWGCVTYVIHRL